MKTQNKTIIITLSVVLITLLVGAFVFWRAQSNKELTPEKKLEIANKVIDEEKGLSEAEKQLYKGLAEQAVKQENTDEITYPITKIDRNTPAKLAYYTIGVTNVEEKDMITGDFSEPQGAKAGTKFVLVTLSIVNTTKEDFDVTTDNFKLIDQNDREYSDKGLDYSVEDYLDYKTIAPDINDIGVLLFEVPIDSKTFTLKVTSEDAQKDYRITL